MMESAQYLRDLGVSPSPQRVAVYDFLRAHPVHPAVDDIFNALRPALPSISRTTVYNTVKRLAAAGAIREVIIEDGELRYDADLRPHGHFKCLSCGTIFDLMPPEDVPPVGAIHGVPEGFEITETHLCCRGYCDRCRRKDAGTF